MPKHIEFRYGDVQITLTTDGHLLLRYCRDGAVVPMDIEEANALKLCLQLILRDVKGVPRWVE